jgi:hypothetical protein
MEEKGELKTDVSSGREGISLNSAYAFSDHFSIMANGFSAYNNSSVYQNRSNLQAEIGLGFFKTFPQSYSYETFIGASRGKVNSDYSRPTDDLRQYWDMNIFSPANPALLSKNFPPPPAYTINGYGNYYTVFMQHSVGFNRDSKSWNSFSWTFRGQYVNFDKYTESISGVTQSLLYNVRIPDKFFIQLLLTDKIGLSDHFMLTMQLGMNFDVNESIEVVQWNRVFYSAGIAYTLDTKNLKIGIESGRQRKQHGHKTLPKRKYRNIFQWRY